MSLRPAYSERASKLLAETLPEPEPPSPEDRERAISAIRHALRSKARRQLLVRGFSAAAAIAACFATYLAWRGKESISTPGSVRVTGEALAGEVIAVQGSQELALGSNFTLSAGDRVLTRSGAKAELKLSTGTKLFLDERTELTVVERGPKQVFTLGAGAIRADVAKLKEGESFIVRTVDADIEVRGTSFGLARVEGSPPCAGGSTALTVYEGMVLVRSGEYESRVLTVGQEWQSACPRHEVGALSNPGGDSRPPRAVPSTGRAPAPPAGTLSARGAPTAPVAQGLQPVNDLFAEAMDQKRRGDKRQALATLQRLDLLYPSSPLSESATVERMKLLASVDAAGAETMARAYLEKYPHGFARSLAENIVAKAR